MKSPLELLKPFANRLARICVSDDGGQAVSMLRQLGLLGQSPTAASTEESSLQSADHNRIGIWEPKIEDSQTVFVRCKDLVQDWHLWANVGRIEAKEARKRVVFIGESVARGFLYDPEFTPAMALERILQSRLGKTEIEVVDLARTNLGFEVQDLAISALNLEPDLVIIFSGNNWDKVLPTNIPAVDTLLLEQGASGFKESLEHELSERVDRLVHKLTSLYKSKNIPLVWILPEFNLGDWRDPITNAPHLSEGKNEQWIKLRQKAEEALQVGEPQRASAIALEMVELDQGTCVTGLYVLAECRKRARDWDGSRRYLELARDAAICDTSKNISPRTYSVTEKVLRQRVPPNTCQLVDLPEVFKEYLHGQIPDRRLFVDYCHLTSEGIQIAMSSAASCALRHLAGISVAWQTLMQECVLPNPRIEAETAFLAAIHNAHWWQSYELVHHYCTRAIKACPEIATVMTKFVDLQTRRAPILMCKSTEHIATMGSPLMQHYLLRFNYQRLDSLLLEAIASSLGDRAADVRKTLNGLRKEEHSVTQRATNLLDYYFCSEGSQQEVMWVVPHLGGYLNHKTNHYYKAYWRESKFVFVAEEHCPVGLSLTCRLPDLALSEGTIALMLNGELVGKSRITREWQTWDITISPEILCDGLNHLKVLWPIPIFPGLKAFAPVATDLTEKLYPEFFCVFGEIHSFMAFDGRNSLSAQLNDTPSLSIMEIA